MFLPLQRVIVITVPLVFAAPNTQSAPQPAETSRSDISLYITLAIKCSCLYRELRSPLYGQIPIHRVRLSLQRPTDLI